MTAQYNTFLKIGTVIFMVSTLLNCQKKLVPTVDYAEEMRYFIISLSQYAKSIEPNFMVVPQNGASLLSANEEDASQPATAYLAAIDGQGQEDLFFGYEKDDKASDEAFQNFTFPFLDLAKTNDKQILVTDYCSSSDYISTAQSRNTEKGYISFVATDRELRTIPAVALQSENDNDIFTLMDAKNFLYLINPSNYVETSTFIAALDATNYDVFIIDLFDSDDNAISAADIAKLQTKPNGAKRLVLAYMSIGEAENYRYYWKKEWVKRKTEPDWIYEENKNWKGNYKVFYWMPDWQNLIYGSTDAYLN
ncbi:MAG: endo alpha-1,4 polygalactosaminidase, partial [Putridiphycobacter sp.]|nr:endo alpha-1,4 polygalactosaminidase [Putridiphycobacter sp.]